MKSLTITLLCFFSVLFSYANPPEKNLKKQLKGFRLIPAGKAIVNEKETEVADFYISETEVSNQKYQSFLAYLKSSNDINGLKKALHETEPLDNVHPPKFDTSYYSSLGFKNFPVVSVSYEAAKLYCKWLESELNKNLAGEAQVEVRLPTDAQWIRAARGDKHYSMYPWGSPRLKNGKGRYLANFKMDQEPKIDLKLPNQNFGFLTTTEVFSYIPNEFGLYNMSGNVAEMLEEKGKCKGGSWATDGKTCEINTTINYISASSDLGFRPVIVVKH
jgi:formylglycine-generating enzyme required for sulfatase activity